MDGMHMYFMIVPSVNWKSSRFKIQYSVTRLELSFLLVACKEFILWRIYRRWIASRIPSFCPCYSSTVCWKLALVLHFIIEIHRRLRITCCGLTTSNNVLKSRSGFVIVFWLFYVSFCLGPVFSKISFSWTVCLLVQFLVDLICIKVIQKINPTL